MVAALSRRPMSVAVLAIMVSTFLLAGLQAHPRNGQDVAVVFPPWIDSGNAIGRVARAGGAIVRLGIVDTILVVHGEGGDFASRLRASGAWLVVDPVAFGGCLVQQDSSLEGRT